jgi:DNA-binding NarL/FixJ family response regulator
MLSILIVDDHPVVRQRLRQMLIEEFQEVIIAEAGDGVEAIVQVRNQNWDVVILDIGIPGMSGLELLKELKEVRPDTRVLVLTMYPEQQYATRFLRAGAAGYTTKDRARPELVNAIRVVLSGERYVSPNLSLRMGARPERPHEALSDRELKVMLGLAGGKRLTDIAQEMNLSIKTVSTYKRRILDKMHMTVNAELTRYAIEHGLI